MTKLIKLFALMTMIAVILPSCSVDLGPDVDNDDEDTLPTESIATYTGTLTYTSNTGNVITNLDGEAKLSKSGNTYKITFSDGVPSLTNISFVKDSNDWVSVSTGSSVSGITVDDEDLILGVTKDGNNWAFSGEK